MRKIYLTVLMAMMMCPVTAQDGESFDEFRQRMLNDYGSFRKGILDDYARFLDTVWTDYETFTGKSLYPDKKPKVVPEASPADDTPVSVIPTPNVPEPAPATPEPQPVITPVPVAPVQRQVTFDFLTAKVSAAKPGLQAPPTGWGEHAISVLWRSYQDDDIYNKVSPSLEKYRAGCHLGDWLTFVLVRRYAHALYPGDDNSATVLTHYLMTNMGYNVRIGRDSEWHLLLLVPFRQMVYARPYLVIGDVNYYIFMEQNGRDVSRNIKSLATCSLPEDADLGKSLSLVIDKPLLPLGGGKAYEVTDGTITVKGEVPDMPVRLASGCVQSDIPVYAASCLSETFRKELVRQVASQIEGLSEVDAVNRLLHFIQYAFKYSTDDDQFGYEKPYFVEENFYYPANDCEDRSVLLAFLVRNILHLDVHLLSYPNHEATAIRFTDQSLKGDGYVYSNGSVYLICDPTYIGAGVGRCMPQFENVKPEVELW